LPTSDGSTLRIRKAAFPDPDVTDLYRIRRVADAVIKPQRTWSTPDSD
jgi:hypothetical protein